MKRLKVFLSKSLAGDQSAYYHVRKALEDEGVEIVEYIKGAWDSQLMLDCDRLVIIPHELTVNCPLLHSAHLGKGQDGQVRDWVAQKSSANILVIRDINYFAITAGEYKSLVSLDKDWKTRYSIINIYSSKIELREFWPDWADFYKQQTKKTKSFARQPAFLRTFRTGVIDHTNPIQGKTESLKPEINELKKLEAMFYDGAAYKPQIYKTDVKTNTLVKPMLCLAV